MFWFIIFCGVTYNILRNDLVRSDKPHKHEIFKATKAFIQKITKKYDKYKNIVKYNMYSVYRHSVYKKKLFIVFTFKFSFSFMMTVYFCAHHESRLFPYILLRNINNKVVFYIFSEKMFVMHESSTKFFSLAKTFSSMSYISLRFFYRRIY